MFIMWYASHEKNDTLELVMVVVFVCAFEFGPGPIVWLYISEICNDKATSVGIFINWVFTLTVSLLAPFLLNDWTHEYTWLIFAGTSLAVSFRNFSDCFNLIGATIHHILYEGDKRSL